MANLRGVIDIHIHAFPDVRPRKVDDLSLAREAARVGARAVVLKSHFFPTTERAWIASQVEPRVAVFGGITLNPSVGGLNRFAVELAIRMGARFVWLPTLFSSRHRAMEGGSGGIESVKDGKVVPELVDIMKLLAEHPQVVLSTGHLSGREVFAVVEEAAKQGVRNIVVTHPEHRVVDLTIDEQLQLASSHAVLFERCLAQPAGGGKYHYNLAQNVEAIRAVGHETTIVSTDSGQVETLFWSEGLARYIDYLAEHGVSASQIDWMTKTLPARLLQLDNEPNTRGDKEG